MKKYKTILIKEDKDLEELYKIKKDNNFKKNGDIIRLLIKEFKELNK